MQPKNNKITSVKLELKYPSDFSPGLSLVTGQCFDWEAIDVSIVIDRIGAEHIEAKCWSGTVSGYWWLVTCDERNGHITVHEMNGAIKDEERAREWWDHYLFVDEVPRLGELYAKWSEVDTSLAYICGKYTGVRLLRQEPLSCLIAFIASSNNNINRIYKLVKGFKEAFGERLGNMGDESRGSVWAFPTYKSLKNQMVEQTPEDAVSMFRNLGWGYRARYLSDLFIKCRDKLDVVIQHEARPTLADYLCLPGVGPKVGNCVLLYTGVDLDAVPVDVHIARAMHARGERRMGGGSIKTLGSKGGWLQYLMFINEREKQKKTSPRSSSLNKRDRG